MTLVKDDEPTGTEAVAGAIGVAQTEDYELEFMTDSKLSDDWSIIGSKGLDNEGSDGESVEVIPCEEEKSEDSVSADSTSSPDALIPVETTSPNELAIQTRENIMQTEEVALLRNFTIWHPGIVVFSIVCHLLITLVFYSVRNDPGEFPDLKKEALSDNISPGMLILLEDWEEKSSRSPQDKGHIKKFLKKYFPWDTFDEEIVALLQKDMMEDSIITSSYKKRRYILNPPPPVRAPVDEPSMKHPPRFGKNLQNGCTNCKKYFFEFCKKYFFEYCKIYCQRNKGKGLKYYYDKIVTSVVKKFPDLTNPF